MIPAVSAQCGPKTNRLADLNRRNQVVWKKRRKLIDKLCSNRELLEAVIRRVNSTCALLKAPTDPAAALARLREARSFEQEALDLASALQSSKFAQAQAKRGKEWRVKIGPERIPLRAAVKKLISRPEYRDLRPRELLPHFYSELQTLECAPEWFNSGPLCNQTIQFQYYALGATYPKTRTIKFVRFRKIVLDLRKEIRLPG